ncbi:MAG: GNAT family N-acetyltransferase [Vulcanimicrobiaceae bacterium]
MPVQSHRLRDTTNVRMETLGPNDEADVAAFLRAVPERDLLFVGFDVRDAEVVHRWANPTAHRDAAGAVARRGAEILGLAVLQRDRAPWKRHVGSVLVVVSPQARGLGLGQVLVRQAIQVAGELGLEKIAARMVVEDRNTVHVFEKLGFRQEGLLLDHAKASDGTLYDIAYMGLSCKPRSTAR